MAEVENANRPPLSEFILKYHQYKDGTATLSSWLAENALKCGFDITPVAAPAAAKAGGGRLKGKARKQAKQTAAKSSSTPVPSGPQYIINVSQFVPMAKAIAAYKPKLHVPPALNHLFDRVIEARRLFNSWYAGMSKPEAKASNDRHIHFIDVLQATWEILVPFEEARKTVKPSPKKENERKNGLLSSLENRFANLHVESPSDSSGDHATPIPPSEDNETYKLSTNINVQVQRDELEVEEDFFLAIYTFMSELADAKGYVANIWELMATDPAKLPQTALQTNLAIQLVRRAEMSLDNFLERPKTFPASKYPTWTFPFILLYKQAGFLDPEVAAMLPPKARLDNLTKGDFPIEPDKISAYEELLEAGSDFYFAKPFQVFLYAVQRSMSIGNEGTSMGAVDVGMRCSNKGDREIFETFNRIQAVALSTEHNMAEDEVTRGVRVATETKTVPIWAVFGFQCLLDIKHLLDTHEDTMSGCALSELQRHVSMAVKNFKEIDVECLKPPIGPTPPHVEDLTRMIHEINDETLKGSLTKQVVSHSQNLPRYFRHPDFFLEYNPIRCGLMLYNLRLQLHDRALVMDTGLLILVPMIHLYKMCQLVYPEMPAWPDMEFLLLHQDVERLFFGGLPTSLTETTTKYALAMGMSAQSLSIMKRTGKMKALNFDKMRFVQNTCPIGSILVSSLGGYAKDDDMVLLELLRWLNDPKRMELADSILDRAPESTFVNSETHRTLSAKAEIKQKVHEMTKFPHASIADTIQFSDVFMESERDVLNFDWIEFMYTVNELATHLSSILGRHYPTQYQQTKGLFSGMVTEMMSEAEGAEKRANTTGGRSSAGLAELAPAALKEIRDAMQSKGLTRSPRDKRQVKTKNGKQEAIWWTMDRGVAGMIRRYGFGFSSFLTISEQFVKDHLYKNWPIEDLERSFTIQIARAMQDNVGYRGKRDKEWGKADALKDAEIGTYRERLEREVGNDREGRDVFVDRMAEGLLELFQRSMQNRQ